MPLLISACTRRKRPPPEVWARDLVRGTVGAVGRHWMGRLTPLARRPARELYCGRSAREAERAAGRMGADILFASAGLGWIEACQPIPSYGMTILAGEDNVLARLQGGATARDWWGWLGAHSPFATSLASAVAATTGPVLVALPRPYLVMVEADLLGLPNDDMRRLRIIQRPNSLVPSLKDYSLSYDDRLEGDLDHAGTLSDFTARAARHFVEQVFPGREDADASAHGDAVQNALAQWTAKPKRIGERRADGELRQIVAQHWDQARGRTTKLLRILRDDLGIACEQGRFARLVANMRAERETG